MASLFEWFFARDSIVAKASPFVHPLQKPMLFLPGLRAQMFHDPGEWSWAAAMQSEYSVIRAEVEAALSERRGFQPYRLIENEKFVMRGGRYGDGLGDAPDWNMFYFYYLGRRIEENCRLCPRTAAILERLPGFVRTTIASYSALNPGTRLVPHYGPTNAVLRVHLGLRIPEGCGLRVGTEQAAWQEGKLLFFSDAFEHEAWNEGEATRFVLFFDVFHPDFAVAELPVVEHFLHSGSPDGGGDFWGRMQALRDQDAERLTDRRWWT